MADSRRVRENARLFLRELGQTVESIAPRDFARRSNRWLDALSFWMLLTPRVFGFNRAFVEAADLLDANHTPSAHYRLGDGGSVQGVGRKP